MISIKNKEEIEIQRKSALLVSATLAEVATFLKPGISTLEIDQRAETFIRDHKGVPSFKGYGDKRNPFPFSLCISINEAIVHGFPSKYELNETDIVSIDCGVYMNGFHGDSAYTFAMAGIHTDHYKLLQVTKESVFKGVEQAVEGNRVGDISYAIEQYTYRQHGYGIVRELVGHGVGRQLHEDPQVPNYGRRGDGKRLKEGMVLAIEPMINLGTHAIAQAEDGWTIITADGKVSAHYEHTTWVRKGTAETLSSFEPIEKAEALNSNLKAVTRP